MADFWAGASVQAAGNASGQTPIDGQAIGGSIPAAGTFTALSGASFAINNTDAAGINARFHTTNAATDQNNFDIFSNSGSVGFRFVNDAYTAATPWLQASRGTGYTTLSVTITAPTINLTGNTVTSGNATALSLGVGVGGPTWTQGTTAPAATAPVGSLYSRVGGAVGATLYVSRGAGTWAAVAGV